MSASVLHSTELKSPETARGYYRHTQKSIAAILPFCAGGAILYTLSLIIDTAYHLEISGGLGTDSVFAAILHSLGNATFVLLLPVLSGLIAKSVGGIEAMLPGFVGGYIAGTGATLGFPTGNTQSVSGYIGAVISGFAAGFIILILKYIFGKLGMSRKGTVTILVYPALGILITGLLILSLSPVVGLVNVVVTAALASVGNVSKLLLGALIGACMGLDLGGVFTKAAFVFGAASLTTGDYDITAAVMISGMIPPLTIAMCATIFRGSFSKEDRTLAYANFAFGLCFVSQGVIPFAVKDPLRVIPSCVAGSTAAGLLSMGLGCRIDAPLGGVLAAAQMSNAAYFALALLAGMSIGATCLGLMKHRKNRACATAAELNT